MSGDLELLHVKDRSRRAVSIQSRLTGVGAFGVNWYEARVDIDRSKSDYKRRL